MVEPQFKFSSTLHQPVHVVGSVGHSAESYDNLRLNFLSSLMSRYNSSAEEKLPGKATVQLLQWIKCPPYSEVIFSLGTTELFPLHHYGR